MQIKQKLMIQVRKAVFRRCSTCFIAIQKHGRGPGPSVDFSRGDTSSELNRLLRSDGPRGILNGADNCSIDMIFSCAYDKIYRLYNWTS